MKTVSGAPNHGVSVSHSMNKSAQRVLGVRRKSVLLNTVLRSRGSYWGMFRGDHPTYLEEYPSSVISTSWFCRKSLAAMLDADPGIQ